MMSRTNSPSLNSLDYQLWCNAGVLQQAATLAKTDHKFKNSL